MSRKLIFEIKGGIGKSIIATSVLPIVKGVHENKEIIVTTAYPEVFIHNPLVFRAYNFNSLGYFWEEHIKEQDSLIYAQEPYKERDYVYRKGHIRGIWIDLYQLGEDSERQPSLYLTERENQFVFNKYNLSNSKPLFIIQTNGGYEQNQKYSWFRDLDITIAQKVVNHFKDKYRILHIRKEHQFTLENTESISAPIREIFSLIYYSSKRLFIDSFCSHAAAALNKPSVVTWLDEGQKTLFSWPLHTNLITLEKSDTKNYPFGYFDKFNIGGEPVEYPFACKPSELFDSDMLIYNLEKINEI